MNSSRVVYVGLYENKVITAVGILKLNRSGVMESGEFAYGNKYLESRSAIPLNNEYIPLSKEVYSVKEKRLRDGGALPLTFKDALPDTWGRRVLEMQYGSLDDIDTLLLTNTDRIGAMVFSESLPIVVNEQEPELHDLNDLYEAVNQLERSIEVTPKMRRLLQKGGTLGGARPKASFTSDNHRWIAKFPALGDGHDVELLEFCTMKVAEMVGIDIPELKLVDIPNGHALLVKRFDRYGEIADEKRVHYLSAASVLNVAYESNDGSYLQFAQSLRKISADPKKDLDQLFKRLIFNLLIDNTDDHVKNHGVTHVGKGKYKLSPAFDVLMQLSNLGYQELAIKPGNNQSKISIVYEIAPYFGVQINKVNSIVKSITQCIDENLIPLLQEHGANKKLINNVDVCLSRQRSMISN